MVLCGGCFWGENIISLPVVCVCVCVLVPPPPPTGVSVASCTGDSVTLEWEGPTDTDSPVTSYVLSATPTVENCNTTCNTTTAQYTFTGLLTGVNYSVTVRSDICDGNLQGETSSPFKFSVDGQTLSMYCML